MKFGHRIIEMADRLAEHSETPDGLTCTYLSAAHRAVAAQLRAWMEAVGLEAEIDAVGNVVGRLRGPVLGKTLLLASHYDTVRNAGKYDGRLGILAPLLVAEHLHAAGEQLPFTLEVIAFAEEEGVRFSTPYIGSSAIAGRFEPVWLERQDSSGARLRDIMQEAGGDPRIIGGLARRADNLIGYIEVHIEQGPVLLHENLPVGIVTSIAGAVRCAATVTGTAGHAGTVPMQLRHDAAAAAAEIVLAVERRCSGTPMLVGTVGQLAVRDGAINVIPARCDLALDIRAADDPVRDAALADILLEIKQIAARRGVGIEVDELTRTPAVSCARRLQDVLAESTERAGIRPFYLSSGAGHDALMFHGLTDIAMLFVRCGHGGISHSPLETVTAEDAGIAVRILLDAVRNLARVHAAP
jgi:allantoate deiminase/N-carbamoyl-L-amino-acid hydrolase